MDRVEGGADLAAVTNGVVGLFSKYYGRGPTKAKTHLLGDDLLLTVLEDTMTVVERRLVELGQHTLVRQVRLTFQETMAPEFRAVVEAAVGRRVVAYHSQLSFDPDLGFEFFILEPTQPR
ncbi:MAG TPA: Na-translocating system protein MpsC family protein [Thermoleophilaceae bacterium]